MPPTLFRKRRPTRRRRPPACPRPALRFTPTAWAKLVFLRDLGETEVGAFGLSAEADPLLIEDLRLIRQRCSVATVAFDDEAVADFFDEQVDRGLSPERFARAWLHTHPGGSALPSSIDEETFARVFGRCDWAVMFILARGGAAYARLRFSAGPGGSLRIPVAVDWSRPFAGTDADAWIAEYASCVRCDERCRGWPLLEEDLRGSIPPSDRPAAKHPDHPLSWSE